VGKTLTKVKMWNIMDEEKIKKGRILPIEVDAQVDNGATAAAILTEQIATELNLIPVKEAWVKYANERREKKKVVIGLRMEILGRDITCDAIIEPERKMPLIGQFALEVLDLWIIENNGKLTPNPESPDMPLLELLEA
jgi:predicted aspartyl protease